ncbi:MAG: hypothetical protein H8E84_00545 [Flavobacteriales bacterium]|nr:hypothetical protein [Flavobacteriales bacterium]
MIKMSQDEVKDTVELIAINATGIGLSLTNIDAVIRTLILVGTLIFTIVKIVKVIKDWKSES